MSVCRIRGQSTAMLASTDGLTRRVEIGRLLFRAVGAGKAVAIGTNSLG